MAMRRWKHTLDIKAVWQDDDMGLPEKGKAIAERIKAAPFYKTASSHDHGDLEQIVDELEDAAAEDDVDWFDMVWNAFYDWADANSVWVKTVF